MVLVIVNKSTFGARDRLIFWMTVKVVAVEMSFENVNSSILLYASVPVRFYVMEVEIAL